MQNSRIEPVLVYILYWFLHPAASGKIPPGFAVLSVVMRGVVLSRCAMDSSVCRELFSATRRQMHRPSGLRCHRHASGVRERKTPNIFYAPCRRHLIKSKATGRHDGDQGPYVCRLLSFVSYRMRIDMLRQLSHVLCIYWWCL